MNLAEFQKSFLPYAIACAHASSLAYQAATIESDLAHVLILPGDGFNVVAFRGTANLRDAITDARCVRKRDIHMGFNVAFQSVSMQLRDALKSLGDAPIYFCGHSLGGANSVLAAFMFARPQDYVFTFGQPRVGSAKFAAACEETFGARHFRFVNQEDIVPRVPLWISGYRHSGQEIFFPSLGGARFGAPIWFKLASDIYGTYLDYKFRHEIAQLEDHHVAQYVAKVASLAPAPSLALS